MSINIENNSNLNTNVEFAVRQGDLNKLPEVLSEFLGTLPPDSTAKAVLEKMILRDKAVHSPLITVDIDGKEVLLDGHMRLQVIMEHRITDFSIKKLNHIHTKTEAIYWMIENCNSYRKLKKAQRVELALNAEAAYKKIAKVNQSQGGKEKQALSKLDKAFSPIDCLQIMANEADVSKQYVADAKYIFSNGNTEERQRFRDEKVGASSLRKQIEKRKHNENKETKPPVIYVNPARGKYVNEIIQGDCLKVLDDMHFDGINDVVALIVSPRYNVGLDYCSSCSDDTPYEEYLEFLSKMIYKAQLLGRDGMRICINCTDTYNKNSKEDGGNLMHNIIHDLSSKVDAINKKYPNECNLLYWGNIHWSKQNSNVIPFLGSYQAPVLKCDSENILVWMKNQRKLVPQNGINCKPQDENIFSDATNEYIITKKQYIEWTYQTWNISPRNDADHPATFPYEIPHRLIKMFTCPKDGIVLDCCSGSGTTCEEAVRLQRDFVGIEISSEYCEVAKARVEKARAEKAA